MNTMAGPFASDRARSAAPPSDRADKPETKNPRPLRIAIADDHAVVRTGYRRLLELDQRVQVVAEFADGESAYRWLAANEADVLILDLGMPGQGGLATLQRLHRRVPALRVLIFTMHESADLAAQSLRAGAAGYITKSSAPETLVAAVHTVSAGEESVSPDIARMLAESARPSDALHEALSPREFEIFLLLAAGHGVEQIATARCLSAKTIANYQTAIRQKTGLGSSLEMYRYAEAHGLLAVCDDGVG
jgi:DNA-binding NarL/FixJ family response regulator